MKEMKISEECKMVKIGIFYSKKGRLGKNKTIIGRQRCDLIAPSVSDSDIYLKTTRKRIVTSDTFLDKWGAIDDG